MFSHFIHTNYSIKEVDCNHVKISALKSETTLLRNVSATSARVSEGTPASPISFPEPAKFLRRMLDKNEALERTGSKSPQITDLLYCTDYTSGNQSGSPNNWSFPEPSFSPSMRCKKLAGSGYEIQMTSRLVPSLGRGKYHDCFTCFYKALFISPCFQSPAVM